jgi:hypothetical protein
MTAHGYLQQLLTSHELWQQELATLRSTRDAVETVLRRSHGTLPRFYYAGSFGKDTLIRAAYDLDIVMYFPSTENRTLGDLFWGVHRTLVGNGLIVQPKTVALRLPYQGFHIDIVPGRAQDATFRYATLFKNTSPTSSTMQTSLKIHIESIRNSGTRDFIRLAKLWNLRQSLSWPTFALEQTVITALVGKRKDDLSTGFVAMLEFIRDRIVDLRLLDPANTNNVIELSTPLRTAARAAAVRSLGGTWEQAVW